MRPPVRLAILALVVVAVEGTLLFFVYGIGLSTPLLLVGTASGAATARMARSPAMVWIERGSGMVLLAAGFYLLWLA